MLGNGAQFVERAFFHQFQRIAGHSVEYAEHAYYLFLGHQSEDRRHGRLPVAKA